jgi:hypothetical protein
VYSNSYSNSYVELNRVAANGHQKRVQVDDANYKRLVAIVCIALTFANLGLPKY